MGSGVGSWGAGAGASAARREAGGRRLARQRRPKREGVGLAGLLALRHWLRATGQVAGAWGRTDTPLRGTRWVWHLPSPTPVHWRGSLKTLPATMCNFGRPGWGKGPRGKTNTCFLSKGRVCAVGVPASPGLCPLTTSLDTEGSRPAALHGHVLVSLGVWDLGDDRQQGFPNVKQIWGMIEGCFSPRGHGEAWCWTEKGPGDTPCLASLHPSGERWQRILPTPTSQLTALLGGGEVTVAASQGRSRQGENLLPCC